MKPLPVRATLALFRRRFQKFSREFFEIVCNRDGIVSADAVFLKNRLDVGGYGLHLSWLHAARVERAVEVLSEPGAVSSRECLLGEGGSQVI
jgi:hypothetical protein